MATRESLDLLAYTQNQKDVLKTLRIRGALQRHIEHIEKKEAPRGYFLRMWDTTNTVIRLLEVHRKMHPKDRRKVGRCIADLQLLAATFKRRWRLMLKGA
ncbi:hypothetical protein SM033_00027 [Vibrio phage vB_VpaM_sm033]|nr:hypothetical protein SM033_00027 [Vibrio phage vB_VpaM_sm033]